MNSIQEFLAICWNFISTIKFGDILDISIIAYLIYYLASLVRKTSSANVVKGIVLLIAIMWLSSILNLSVVSYLLGETFKLGFLAVIVLFQPDIRRILEQVGSSSFSGIFAKKVSSKVIDLAIKQTVLACAEMSKTHTGALIVFERNINLDSYLKTGSILDAEPSSELLKNIFYPKAPLHDGAVIIRNARIAGAACMLPLSNNLNLSRDLGMRHRAGVGISERSDAIVAIVSEESGSISLASDGMLKRHFSLETFEILLRNELIPQGDSRRERIMKKLNFRSKK